MHVANDNYLYIYICIYIDACVLSIKTFSLDKNLGTTILEYVKEVFVLAYRYTQTTCIRK
jgi:hypothetical protein